MSLALIASPPAGAAFCAIVAFIVERRSACRGRGWRRRCGCAAARGSGWHETRRRVSVEWFMPSGREDVVVDVLAPTSRR